MRRTINGDVIREGGRYLTRGGKVARVLSTRTPVGIDTWPVKYMLEQDHHMYSCTEYGMYDSSIYDGKVTTETQYDLMEVYKQEDDMSNEQVTNLHNARSYITGGFTFSETPEGSTFWWGVCDKLSRERDKLEAKLKPKVTILGKEVTLSKDAKAALDKVLAEIPELKSKLIGD